MFFICFHIHDHKSFCKQQKNLMMYLISLIKLIIFFLVFLNFSNIKMYFNLFRPYWRNFNITLSLFWHSLRENKFVYSNKLLPFNKKSINPIQKNQAHYWIIYLYFINILCSIFISNEFSNFFSNTFNSKAIKVCYIFTIHI